MKNQAKSKRLLSNIIDFTIAAALFSLIIGAVFFIKALLYPGASEGGEMRIRTEIMPSEHRGSLHVGDTVFDTLTKRRVGEITDMRVIECEDGKIYFLLALDSVTAPRGKSLRTAELWFYFAEEDL